MIYVASLTIPANTPKSNPARETFSISSGTIENVYYLIPSDNDGLVEFVLCYHSAQIYPTSLNEAFRGAFGDVSLGERYAISDSPFELEMVGWSPGATLSHLIIVQVTLSQLVASVSGSPVPISLPEGL
jgi:hypothetical protein